MRSWFRALGSIVKEAFKDASGPIGASQPWITSPEDSQAMQEAARERQEDSAAVYAMREEQRAHDKETYGLNFWGEPKVQS